ncbi:MAG: DUF2284 domain-containing protein [Methanomassiliicoccaceae archaeon]|nr:DUF2284 domain-containing protein [Methanomassiliicoccaceae archaeon]
MIGKVWETVSKDPAAAGYSFKNIGLPSPDARSMKKCRELCAENTCGAYGVTWGCPPGAGTETDCLDLVKSFSKAAILIKRFDNIDLNDRDLLKKLCLEHQDVCRSFGNALRAEGCRAMPLSDGGCKYCGECSYPDDPCRFPDQRMASIAAYGIMMDEYMKENSIDFEFRKDGMTLYGLILYDEP